MRTPILAGNWKMYKTVPEAVQLAKALAEHLARTNDREIVICPPFTALYPVAEVTKGTNIQLGAQNLYPEPEGAYTGEVSPTMLRDLGCVYVILGHSERREYFKETDGFVNRKLRLALTHALRPILCVGEKLEEREAGREVEVVEGQVRACLVGIEGEEMTNVAIAYEPVWAIGTGRTASPEQAQSMHKTIREVLSQLYDPQVTDGLRIMYGGSVKPENIDDLMRQPDIDGALVGGASLKAESFTRIVKFEA